MFFLCNGSSGFSCLPRWPYGVAGEDGRKSAGLIRRSPKSLFFAYLNANWYGTASITTIIINATWRNLMPTIYPKIIEELAGLL